MTAVVLMFPDRREQIAASNAAIDRRFAELRKGPTRRQHLKAQRDTAARRYHPEVEAKINEVYHLTFDRRPPAPATEMAKLTRAYVAEGYHPEVSAKLAETTILLRQLAPYLGSGA